VKIIETWTLKLWLLRTDNPTELKVSLKLSVYLTDRFTNTNVKHLVGTIQEYKRKRMGDTFM